MLGKQAKTLSKAQIEAVLLHLQNSRFPIRNRVIFLLSVRAGLRAKEIACLTWSMVTDAQGELADCIRLPDAASKGSSGGVIPLSKDLVCALAELQNASQTKRLTDRIIQTNRSKATNAQVIVNMFSNWYNRLGFEGCSSHSGRRTFITNMAKNIGRFGGSLRDVQLLARHSSLAMTQRYIEIDTDAIRRVINVT